MKPLSIAAGLLSLLSSAIASSNQEAAGTSKVANFKPPQVFKNANLVHIISVEKNYVKEQINVLVENVASTPQDEYYLPFTTEQMVRMGGFEVKDRKDASLGPFTAEATKPDPLA